LNLFVFGSARCRGAGVFLGEGEDELANCPLRPGTGVGSRVFVQGHLRLGPGDDSAPWLREVGEAEHPPLHGGQPPLNRAPGA